MRDTATSSSTTADGDLGSDPDRFASGIASLADDAHRLGLRFGIYTDAGTRTCAG